MEFFVLSVAFESAQGPSEDPHKTGVFNRKPVEKVVFNVANNCGRRQITQIGVVALRRLVQSAFLLHEVREGRLHEVSLLPELI